MNQSFYGSICLTDLLEEAKHKHSAFTKGKNGKIYASVTVWLNESVDKYGNIMSVQLNSTKEMKDSEEKVYLGNMKKSEGPKPITDNDTSDLHVDDNFPTVSNQSPASITEPVDDLPF